MKIEKRNFGTIELRAEGEESRKLVGYAAMFGKRSEDLGGFVEEIVPGAFRSALEGDPDVRALWNHDSNMVLGRTTAGTLKVEEDDTGLRVEIDPPSHLRDMMASVERGDVSQMSFAFSVRQGGQSWEELEDGSILRKLEDLELFEVSPVTFPAYPDTTIAMRSKDQWQDKNTSHVVRRARMIKGLHKRQYEKGAKK